MFVLIFIFLQNYIKDYLIILTTTYIGAYSVVRGLSIILGQYPEENLVNMMINKNENHQLDRYLNSVFILYIIGIFVLTSIGIAIQFFNNRSTLLNDFMFFWWKKDAHLLSENEKIYEEDLYLDTCYKNMEEYHPIKNYVPITDEESVKNRPIGYIPKNNK